MKHKSQYLKKQEASLKLKMLGTPSLYQSMEMAGSTFFTQGQPTSIHMVPSFHQYWQDVEANLIQDN